MNVSAKIRIMRAPLNALSLTHTQTMNTHTNALPPSTHIRGYLCWRKQEAPVAQKTQICQLECGGIQWRIPEKAGMADHPGQKGLETAHPCVKCRPAGCKRPRNQLPRASTHAMETKRYTVDKVLLDKKHTSALARLRIVRLLSRDLPTAETPTPNTHCVCSERNINPSRTWYRGSNHGIE